jgi:UDPglucose 6-dehydrogenase
MNVVMVGTGYVGLVSGLGFAKLGHRVACVDVDANKIAKLDLGEVPFFEPGLPELLRQMQEAGRILFTTDLPSVLSGADVVMIAVGTPPTPTGEADLSAVHAVATTLGAHLEHEVVVVMKSTVPVGTNHQVLEVIRTELIKNGREHLAPLVHAVSLPEFLAEGHALSDFLHPTRIVIGADDPVAASVVERLHEGISGPRVRVATKDAELIKHAANALLATKVSFINEIATLAERVGVDVRNVAHGIGLDPRIGPHFLNAGIGFGGSCLPKDIGALHQIAGHNGYEFKLLSAAIEVNNRQRDRFVSKVEQSLGGLKGRRLAVWGLAFKGGTDDIRESPAIDVVQRLYARGADIVAFDPMAMERAKRDLSDRIEYAPTAVDAATGADALLVLTEWPEFREVSFETLKTQMLTPIVIDGRNLLADLRLAERGFRYEGMGTR